MRQGPRMWQESPSYRYVKATHATEKSYIVRKKKLEDKPTCLVNVQRAGGVAHEQIVEELMAWLQNRSDLTKAMAVKTTEEI